MLRHHGHPTDDEHNGFPRRHKSFEVQRKVIANASFDILDDWGTLRTNIAKAKIIPSMPDEQLPDTENENKNIRKNQ